MVNLDSARGDCSCLLARFSFYTQPRNFLLHLTHADSPSHRSTGLSFTQAYKANPSLTVPSSRPQPDLHHTCVYPLPSDSLPPRTVDHVPKYIYQVRLKAFGVKAVTPEPMASALAAKTRLMSEYKGLQKEKWVNIEVGDCELGISHGVVFLLTRPSS